MTLHRLLLVSLGLTACSDYELQPTSDIPWDAEPDIEVQPMSLDFGQVTSDEASVRQVSVRNLGGSLLSVDSLVFQGAEAFVLLEDPGDFGLEAGAERVLEIGFTASEPEVLEGTLLVSSNDPDSPEISVALLGEGLVPALEISPATYDFGQVGVPCVEELELILQNAGNAALEVEALDYASDRQLSLTDAPATPFTLEPGEYALATVTLETTKEEPATGVLTASSNDPGGEVTASQQADPVWADVVTDEFDVPRDPPVDIVFAVDRSGSMDDDAAALGEAFDTFITTLSAETGGWNIGVLTYDHACFNNGVLDATTSNVEALFQEAVAMGSDEEIVLDERLFQLVDRGLRQTASGACNEGFLRDGALLHVIFVSDEPERSTETASAWTWDYWLERWQAWVSGPSLLVLSGVLDLDDCNEGADGYHEAIEATAGEALSICDADWGAHASALAQASTGFLYSFTLSQPAEEDSIQVDIDGTATEEGWSFDASSNLVVFGDELAETTPAGATVSITYGVTASCE